MPYVSSEVVFLNDGQRLYTRDSDCPVVVSWARRNDAKPMVEWVSAEGSPLLLRPDWVDPSSIDPAAPTYARGDRVWAVPASDLDAAQEAGLIGALVHAATRSEYDEARRALAQAGYPEESLTAVAPPR